MLAALRLRGLSQRFRHACATAATVATWVLHGCGLAHAEEPVRIAVSYFDDAGDGQLAVLRKGFAQMLVTDLSASPDVTLVERAQLDAVLAEVALQQSPWVDPASAVKLGAGLGAAYIVTGSYFVVDARLRIDARLVDVETSEIVASHGVEGAADELFELERRLALGLLDGLGATTSPIARKRLGGTNPHQVSALRHWSMALEADDRGDADAAMAALREALAADPAFQAAAERLAAVEDRVSQLERGGGLVVSPTRWNDHVANFSVHLRRQDPDLARDELLSAIAKAPRRYGLWELALQLPRDIRPTTASDAVPIEVRPVVDAFLAGNRRRLVELNVGAGTEARIALDMLRLALASTRETPSYTELVHAREFIDKFDGKTLSAHAVDASVKVDEYAELRRRWIKDRDPIQWPAAFASIEEASTRNMRTPRWRVQLWLPDVPSGAVHVTLRRDDSHPGWSETPLPVEDRHPLWPPDGITNAHWATLVEGLRADPHAFLFNPIRGDWDLARRSDPLRRGYPIVAHLGQPVETQAEEWACDDNDAIATGHACEFRMSIDKARLPPGPYRFTVTYTDADGVPVTIESARAWATEFIVSSLDDYSANGVAPYAAFPGMEKRPPLARGPDTIAWVAETCWYPDSRLPTGILSPTEQRERTPTFYYDWDYRLFDGDRARLDADETDAWRAYRTALLRRGANVLAPQDCALLALPQLSPGTHTVCVLATFQSGATSFEPTCLHYDIPR